MRLNYFGRLPSTACGKYALLPLCPISAFLSHSSGGIVLAINGMYARGTAMAHHCGNIIIYYYYIFLRRSGLAEARQIGASAHHLDLTKSEANDGVLCFLTNDVSGPELS